VADQSNSLSWLDFNVHLIQNGYIGTRRIGNINISDNNVPRNLLKLETFRARRINIRDAIDSLKDGIDSCLGFGKLEMLGPIMTPNKTVITSPDSILLSLTSRLPYQNDSA
jgi:hypothetical protein